MDGTDHISGPFLALFAGPFFFLLTQLAGLHAGGCICPWLVLHEAHSPLTGAGVEFP